MTGPDQVPAPVDATTAGGVAALDLPPAQVATPDPDEVVVTRSEEQLRAGTETYPVARARLRKVIVTEERTITVVLRHEEYVLDHEPIVDGVPVPAPADGTVAGPPAGDVDTVELVLYAEHPVITTEIVPVERIRMSKHLVSTDETLTGTVRREVVDYDPPR